MTNPEICARHVAFPSSVDFTQTMLTDSYHHSSDEVHAREVNLAQVRSMSTKSFLSNMTMVKALTASGVWIGDASISRNLFVILLIFSHANWAFA